MENSPGLAHPGAMTKAFASLRVSGKGQIEGDGFPRQSTAIKPYAVAHNLKLVKVFREEGMSGATELENRPLAAHTFWMYDLYWEKKPFCRHT